MNKKQIIDRAMQVAGGIGGDPAQSPTIDAHMTAEDLLPHAFRYAYRQLLINGDISFQDVMRRHNIPCLDTGGSPPQGVKGAVPAGVLNEFLDRSFLPDYPRSAYRRYFADYTRPKFSNLITYYTVENGFFYVQRPTDLPAVGLEEPTFIVLHAPSIPAIPADPTTDIPMPERARDTVVMTLALALRGELRLVS